MLKTLQTKEVSKPQASTTKPNGAEVAPTIAIRKSCNPDGIGLSHYVLIDKKAAK